MTMLTHQLVLRGITFNHRKTSGQSTQVVCTRHAINGGFDLPIVDHKFVPRRGGVHVKRITITIRGKRESFVAYYTMDCLPFHSARMVTYTLGRAPPFKWPGEFVVFRCARFGPEYRLVNVRPGDIRLTYLAVKT